MPKIFLESILYCSLRHFQMELKIKILCNFSK